MLKIITNLLIYYAFYFEVSYRASIFTGMALGRWTKEEEA
jgi:hypothetical protein